MGQPKVSVFFSHLSLSDQSLQPVHIFKMCCALVWRAPLNLLPLIWVNMAEKYGEPRKIDGLVVF